MNGLVFSRKWNVFLRRKRHGGLTLYALMLFSAVLWLSGCSLPDRHEREKNNLSYIDLFYRTNEDLLFHAKAFLFPPERDGLSSSLVLSVRNATQTDMSVFNDVANINVLTEADKVS